MVASPVCRRGKPPQKAVDLGHTDLNPKKKRLSISVREERKKKKNIYIYIYKREKRILILT